MKLVAGVDIGNSTTEVVIGRVNSLGKYTMVSHSTEATTGMKGTIGNVGGIKKALYKALDSMNLSIANLSKICINEATPVIGDTAMETITETIITESSMIGHNPHTPAGFGYGVGITVHIKNLNTWNESLKKYTPWNNYKNKSNEEIECNEEIKRNDEKYYNKSNNIREDGVFPFILLVDKSYTYHQVEHIVNSYENSIDSVAKITGIILQSDEAVLVFNRLNNKLPIIDEVSQIERIEEGKLAAIEVAMSGESIQMLSNPYGIASLLGLDGKETKRIIPIAKSLIGKRSGVVIKSPSANVIEQKIPAGEILIHGDDRYTVPIDDGAKAIMKVLSESGNIIDITGSKNSNVGYMLERIKEHMSKVSNQSKDDIRIKDILAVDTLAPIQINGALAGETCLEKAVGIAAMVKTNRLPMSKIASALEDELKVVVEVAGVEAIMASLGALTTPGVSLPLALLDMGGGSTDGGMIYEDGRIEVVHMAGAGELVTLLIQTELGLSERSLAEEIKKYPLAKVESLYYIRLETGEIRFIEEGISPEFYGCVVLLHPLGMMKVHENLTLERIVSVRKEAKQKVFVENAKRVLEEIAPKRNIRNISNIMLVGGCALDFEIPSMLMEEFMEYNIVCGRGNISGKKGPRYAVATGLVLSNIGGV